MTPSRIRITMPCISCVGTAVCEATGSACTNVQDERRRSRHNGPMDGLPGFSSPRSHWPAAPAGDLSLTATGAAFGARRGVAYLAGIVVGMVAVMAIVGERPGRPAAGGAGRDAGRDRAGRGLFRSISPGASPRRRRWRGCRRAPARRPSPAGCCCRWSIPRAMPRWRRCSRASCWCTSGWRSTSPSRWSCSSLIITAVNVAWLLAGAALTRFFREPRTNRVDQRRLRRAAGGVGGARAWRSSAARRCAP